MRRLGRVTRFHVADMSRYLLIDRLTQADVAMYVMILFDEQAFRITSVSGPACGQLAHPNNQGITEP